MLQADQFDVFHYGHIFFIRHFMHKEIHIIYGFLYVLIKSGKDKGTCKFYPNFCGSVTLVTNLVLNKTHHIALT